MPARPLPLELAAVLQRAAAVETAAATRAQWLAAVTASTRLMLAGLDAGWRVVELAPALGLKLKAATS